MTTDYRPYPTHPDNVDGLSDRSRNMLPPAAEPRLSVVVSNDEPTPADLDRQTEGFNRHEPTLYQMQLEAFKQEALDRMRRDNIRQHTRMMMDLMAQVLQHACNMHPNIKRTYGDMPYWTHIEEYMGTLPHRRTALLERQVRAQEAQQNEALRKLRAIAAEMREGQ